MTEIGPTEILSHEKRGRPRLSEGTTTRLTLALPTSLAASLTIEANHAGVSLSELCRRKLAATGTPREELVATATRVIREEASQICKHPKDARKTLGYMTVCGLCNAKLR